MYMERYPLVSALSRPVIVKHLVQAAKDFGAHTVAHGCTGKGNDQVRFEVSIGALAPDLRVLAPVRDSGMSRDKAIIFAEEKDLPIQTSRVNPYSIDQNVWGRAVETGFLEDIWNGPIEDLYEYTENPAAPREPDEVLITFDEGAPVAIDGRPVTMLQAIEEMNRRAGAQGIGRIDMVEDRVVGIKSREIYEAPGAIALLVAHRELENVTIEREQARFKQTVGQRWTELVYDGLWFSPLKRSLDAFIRDTQQHVSGEIRMTLAHGTAVVTGRRSRGVALRLQPRDLRRAGHLRPVAGQGFRAAVGTEHQDDHRPRSAGGGIPVTSEQAPSSPGSGAVELGIDDPGSGADETLGRPVHRRPVTRARGTERVDPVRLGARAVRHRRLPRARQGAAPSRIAWAATR